MENLLLHFDLSDHAHYSEFFIQGHGKKEQLRAYADHPAALEDHKKRNVALALLSGGAGKRLTHFIDAIALPEDQISRLSIIAPAAKDTDILPDLIAVHIHVPTVAYQKVLAQLDHSKHNHPLNLAYLGIGEQQLNTSNQVAVKLAARLFIQPALATAQSIVFHHPEIGSVDRTTTGKLYATYMQNHNDFDQLVNYISNNPSSSNNPWYKKSYAAKADPVTLKESPVTPTDKNFADGKPIDWPKDPETGVAVIPQYALSDEHNGAGDGGVLAAASQAVYSVLRQSKNNTSFGGALWTRSQGAVSRKTSNNNPQSGLQHKERIAALKTTGDAESFWSVKADSSKQYGLDLHADDLTFANNTLSFPLKNWPNRVLGVYVEFQQEDGTPIPWGVLKNTKEGKDLIQPDGFISEAFALAFARQDDKATRLFWGILSSGNSVFGIPFFTNPTDINFKWPHDKVTGASIASRAEVYVGGLGVANGFSDWDSDIDVAGLVGTGILNYGITAASMAFSVAVIGPLKTKLMKSDVKYAVLALGINLGVVAVIVSSAFWESGTAKMILAKMSNFAAGFLFGKAAEFALEKIYQDAIEEMIEATLENITAQEALEQLPFAGWALRVASLAGDIASLAATTIECLASPATYKFQVQESMDLTVTVTPDPAHGTSHQAPIWPMVADHWMIQLKYPKHGNFDGGTTYVKTGPMPGQHDAPISVTFEKVPAGGQIEMIAGVYSQNNWLAGQWISEPKAATPDAKGQLSYQGAITENLVPLTPTTTYAEKQRTGFDSAQQKHIWTSTVFSVDGSFKSVLDGGTIDKGLRDAFGANGVYLPPDNQVHIKVVNRGQNWQLQDSSGNMTYDCNYESVNMGDGTTLYEIGVRNSSRPAPPLPNPKTVCDTSGTNHNLCELVDMTINNRAYQLAYAWRASGMNMPLDKSSNPVENTQMYTMQSISTLNQPSDLILQSGIGFSQMPFIAYNQFGLTPLFALDFNTYGPALTAANGKTVPAQLITAFKAAGITLDPGTTVSLTAANIEWRLTNAAGTVLFDLQYDTKMEKGVVEKVINVFNYIVPGVTNFYMDPRPGPDGHYHLRGVGFNDGIPGSYNFEVDFPEDKANSWGAFPIPKGSSIYQMAVHPSGFVIAIDYGLDKMWALKIPPAATTMANAPLAMPLSGSGALEGLLKQPKAMTIAADGRILILEQGNTRFQSIDTNGNPVAAFKGTLQVTFPNTLIKDLDSGQATEAINKIYQSTIPASYLRQPLFTTYDNDPVSGLDQGIANAALLKHFKDHLLTLPDNAQDIQVAVNVSGSSWLLTNKTSGVTYDIRWDDSQYLLLVNYAANLELEVTALQTEWKLTDRVNSLTFDIKTGKSPADALQVQQLIATAALRTQADNAVQYLDIAIEGKGYIYLLYFTGAGTSAAQYMLDIYNPDGTVLLDAPLSGIAAAKMAVDQWRTLWTLNYETLLGPGNRTEPTVSGWMLFYSGRCAIICARPAGRPSFV